MFKLLKNRKGVTLVELLAVVVILGIIAAIAVPTIGGLIERQKERAAEVTYTQILESAKLYATSESDTLFELSDLTGTTGYLELKDNVVSTTAAGAQVDVWIYVSGNTVTFFAAGAEPDPLTATALTSLFINGFDVLAA